MVRDAADEIAVEIGRRLAEVPGVTAVVLGGSRARGTHRPDSDTDLGLYYDGELDVEALRQLAAEVSDEPALADRTAQVTAPGGWGPWVDGGAWLTVGGQRVDWIYRDLRRVRRVWADCREGRYEIGFQPGHPLGFYSHTYAGEVALCRVLVDPSGELTDLRSQAVAYPQALGEALVGGLWEADFGVRIARYGAAGPDPAYAAGCLFRAVGVLCHALHGRANRWLINEKGMVAAAGRLAPAPPGFAERAHDLLGHVGTGPDLIGDTVDRAAALVSDVRAALGRWRPAGSPGQGRTA